MLRKVKRLAEWTRRNAPVQDFGALLLLGVLMARDQQRVLLLNEFNLVWGEARKGHSDAVVVFADPLNVVGRPVRLALSASGLVEQVEKPVEADR